MKSSRARLIKYSADDKTLVSGDKDETIWKMYGTTLLGLLINPAFVFAYQLGDGDLVFTNENKTEYVIHGDLMLGTATHSLSSVDSWKRAKTKIYPAPNMDEPFAFHLSTDGFSNSYRDE